MRVLSVSVCGCLEWFLEDMETDEVGRNCTLRRFCICTIPPKKCTLVCRMINIKEKMKGECRTHGRKGTFLRHGCTNFLKIWGATSEWHEANSALKGQNFRRYRTKFSRHVEPAPGVGAYVVYITDIYIRRAQVKVGLRLERRYSQR